MDPDNVSFHQQSSIPKYCWRSHRSADFRFYYRRTRQGI